jgi:hypothetical protein
VGGSVNFCGKVRSNPEAYYYTSTGYVPAIDPHGIVALATSIASEKAAEIRCLFSNKSLPSYFQTSCGNA